MAAAEIRDEVDNPHKLYKRKPGKRVFVNRSLMLDRVKFYGFDMDYTLAVYKSPAYESLGFDLLKKRLVDIGYPEAIQDFEYDPTFPIRGLWYDTQYGNMLKVDYFGNILVCVHGFQFLKAHDMHSVYPNMFVQREENNSRYRIFNTLFELPIIYILSCLVDFFSNHSDYTRYDKGVKSGDLTMTYVSMYQDVLAATDHVHQKGGPLKSETVKDLERYVIKDDRLPVLLDRMRAHGSKVFLATNSDFVYTNETGALKIGSHTGPIQSGQIYSGGSVDVFSEMMGVYEKDVLYVGDHIFGDILKSKKDRGWRTFLVVPELSHELSVWTDKRNLFSKLEDLESMIGNLFKNLDSSCDVKPNLKDIQHTIRNVSHEMDMTYGMLGSLFRSGSRQTFFASQVMRYADLYAATFLNLLHYPFSYAFRAPPMLMPHESTVGHEAYSNDDTDVDRMAPRSRQVADSDLVARRGRLERADSIVPHLYASTPRQCTQIQEDEDSSDSAEENK
ncbi:cytosolic purine 5'-nucleotidase-like [Ylistrum balloti]|uniref:cytosolic purine 5'-nucleotidase-like n=1 Tax=Ylistrum balloti TaxID=509963 RepID=UPI002905E72B|nr:cytosolic purine 5'-nucleotidase-like [Ylistrum balloti]